MGTLNILEVLRRLNKNCIAIFITSDKAYDNQEWTWGYRENDKLGGLIHIVLPKVLQNLQSPLTLGHTLNKMNAI